MVAEWSIIGVLAMDMDEWKYEDEEERRLPGRGECSNEPKRAGCVWHVHAPHQQQKRAQ